MGVLFVIEVEADGVLVKVEFKNIEDQFLSDRLTSWMSLSSRPSSKSTSAVVNSVEEGQVLSDLVKYIDGGNMGRALWLTPDVIPGSRTMDAAQIAAAKAAKENEIIDGLIERIRRNEIIIADRYFGIKLDVDDGGIARQDWDDMLFDLEDAMKNGNPKYVEVFDYPFIQ